MDIMDNSMSRKFYVIVKKYPHLSFQKINNLRFEMKENS